MHDDLNPWACVYVGFDEKKSLVVELKYKTIPDDNYSSNRGYYKWLVVEKADLDKLMRKLHTRLLTLPKTIKKLHGSPEDNESWSCREVIDTFNAIESQFARLDITFRRQREEIPL